MVFSRLREYLASIKVFTEFSNRSDVTKQLVRKKKGFDEQKFSIVDSLLVNDFINTDMMYFR